MAFYRKNYFCICDGQQEEMYLDHVATLIKVFPKRVVKFNTTVGNIDLLKRTYVDYDRAAFFDHDFNDNEFQRNIILCNQFNRQRGRSTYHAFSNVNFDLWLILHKEEFNRPVFSNDAYLPDVRRIYGLGATENIKNKRTIKKILDQITLEDVKNAISRANRIRAEKIDTDKRMIGPTICYPNPDFSIHEFLKVVLTDCGEL
ncbi:MAG: RloB domain-containing protein [Bacillota bacterium]|jgi:hypothetical protein